MIMPIDIEKKEFTREKKGYSVSEVDEFLDLITVDYEKLLNENRNMAHKIKFLEKQVHESQKADNSIVDTLETAKSLMADISASAERRAELIMKDAELEAENIKKQAKIEVSKLIEEQSYLKVQVERFREKYRRMLEEEMNRYNADEYGFLTEFEEIEKLEKEREELTVEEEPQIVEKSVIEDTLVVTKPKELFFEEEIKSEEVEESNEAVEDETNQETDETDEFNPFGSQKATVEDLADGLKNYNKMTLSGKGTLFN